MLAKLERLIGEIGDLNSKLILLVGPSRSGKTQLLRQLSAKLNIEPLNVGLELGRRLAATPNNKRGFSAGELLREIALLEPSGERTEAPLLLDNLEPRILPAARRTDLKPIFSFNSAGLFAGVSGQTKASGDGVGRLSRWEDALARIRAEGFEQQ